MDKITEKLGSLSKILPNPAKNERTKNCIISLQKNCTFAQAVKRLNSVKKNTILQRIFGSILGWFVQGLLFIAPITITGIAIYYAFIYIEKFFKLGFSVWSILFFLILVTLIGMLGSFFIAAPVFKHFEKLLTRAPLVKIIYTSVKDLLTAFVGNKRKFTRPVMVKIDSQSDTSRLGFLTEENLNVLNIDSDKVAVYFPYSYSLMGVVLIVPRNSITPIDASPAEVMKFIVSGGLTKLDNASKPDNHA